MAMTLSAACAATEKMKFERTDSSIFKDVVDNTTDLESLPLTDIVSVVNKVNSQCG